MVKYRTWLAFLLRRLLHPPSWDLVAWISTFLGDLENSSNERLSNAKVHGSFRFSELISACCRALWLSFELVTISGSEISIEHTAAYKTVWSFRYFRRQGLSIWIWRWRFWGNEGCLWAEHLALLYWESRWEQVPQVFNPLPNKFWQSRFWCMERLQKGDEGEVPG